MTNKINFVLVYYSNSDIYVTFIKPQAFECRTTRPIIDYASE